MKIFNQQEGHWDHKVNFVDENNVMLGYDMNQDCCEKAGWFIADEPTHKINQCTYIPDLSDWRFDPTYFESVDHATDDEMGADWNALDAGGMAIFRITNGKEEKFIHIYNCHNGYYSHGFEFSMDGNTVRGSRL